jgi:hypothetical protein
MRIFLLITLIAILFSGLACEKTIHEARSTPRAPVRAA